MPKSVRDSGQAVRIDAFADMGSGMGESYPEHFC